MFPGLARWRTVPGRVLHQLRNPGDSDIDFGNLVPGLESYDTILGQTEDALESFHCLFCGRTKNPILSDFRDKWIAIGYAIELALHLAHLFPGIT